MLYILYENSGVYSGRALRNELAKRMKTPVTGGYPKRLLMLAKKHGTPEHIINMGCTEALPLETTVFNDRDKVRASSNKRQARIAFHELGVPSPELFLRPAQVPDSAFPVVGRTTYHKKGQGFWLCRNRNELNRAATAGATHFLQFIPATREYRVHLFAKTKRLHEEGRKPEDYVSLKISEKVWQGQGQPNPNEPQKNHEFGWTFLGPQDRREDELDVVRHAAKEAMAALGLDFGAVDIMYQIRSKIPYALEVNSTPSLADENANTCEVYAERFVKILTQGTAE